MNPFISLARARYSVRKFDAKPISEESLHRILVAGQLAPTACDSQAFHIYAIESEQARAKVAALTKFTFDAPMIFCLCYDVDRVWKNPLEAGITAGDQDCAIVATHMMLAAWEEGVGSCWVGCFPPTKLAESLGLPANHRPVLLMPMGYPAADAAPSPLHEKRLSIEELVTRM